MPFPSSRMVFTDSFFEVFWSRDEVIVIDNDVLIAKCTCMRYLKSVQEDAASVKGLLLVCSLGLKTSKVITGASKSFGFPFF